MKIRRAKVQGHIDLASAVKDRKKCFCKYINNKRSTKENLRLLLDAGENIAPDLAESGSGWSPS